MRNKIGLILIVLLFNSVNGLTQPRNIIKFTPIVFDNMVSTLDYGSLDLLAFSNKYSFAIKYERSVGKRIAIGLWANMYYGSTNDLYTTGGSYSPKDYPNLKIGQCTYEHGGYLLGYESMYYFDDFDSDGPNSGYLGLSLQHGTFTQGMPKARYTDQNYDYVNKSFNEQTLDVNRIGLKLGRTYTSSVSFDIYFSLSYNFTTGPINQNFIAPTQIRPISFGLGMLLGIPF